MLNKKTVILLIMAVVLALPVLSFAQTMSSGNYSVESGRLDAGWSMTSSASSGNVSTVPLDPVALNSNNNFNSNSSRPTNTAIANTNANTNSNPVVSNVNNGGETNYNTNTNTVSPVNENINQGTGQTNLNTNIAPVAGKSAAAETEWLWYVILGSGGLVVILLVVWALRKWGNG